MTTLFDNPSTLRNMSMDELMHYASDIIDHPAVERMVELYFNGADGARTEIAELEKELGEMEDRIADVSYECDELEGALEDKNAKLEEVRQKLEDMITWDHPDEIQEELKRFLEDLNE